MLCISAHVKVWAISEVELLIDFPSFDQLASDDASCLSDRVMFILERLFDGLFVSELFERGQHLLKRVRFTVDDVVCYVFPVSCACLYSHFVLHSVVSDVRGFQN